MEMVNNRENQRHGLSETPVYKAWNNMMRACYNPKCHSYFFNGAQGIRVTRRWHSMQSFYEDMGDRPDGCYLKRIDRKSDFSRENCKWQRKLSNYPFPEEKRIARSLWQHIKEWWKGQ